VKYLGYYGESLFRGEQRGQGVLKMNSSAEGDISKYGIFPYQVEES